MLSGEIPAELGDLTNLNQLFLWGNELTGSIPAELGKLKSLQRLSLGQNKLSGEIPAELGGMTRLQYLYLNQNMLSGSIPAELGDLTFLQELYLNQNNLSGEIPAELGSIRDLRQLSLWGNELTGEIPAELVQPKILQWLLLHDNQLSGSIPTELGDRIHLQFLYLYQNKLSGEIPAELGRATSLQRLLLSRNQLSGSIPTELGDLSNLRQLSLWGNELTGGIPAELGDLTFLQVLYLNQNKLSGEIPAELGDLTNLQYLYLYQNMLSGEIPAELGKLTRLQRLFLHENQLTGRVPSSLGDLSTLERLYLHGNNLNGSIPERLVRLNSLVELSLWSNPQLVVQTLRFELIRQHDRAALRYIYQNNNGAQWTDNSNWLSDKPLSEWHGIELHENGQVKGLDLRNNNLRGPVDGAFSGLLVLETLNLSGNSGLTGELSLGLADNYLSELDISSTGVGVPDDDNFRSWLAGLNFRSSPSLAPTTPTTPATPTTPTTPATPTTPVEVLQEDREEDGVAISPRGMGTGMIEIRDEEGEEHTITIELSVQDGDEVPQGVVPSIILSPFLLEEVETVSFDLITPSEEQLPQGLRLEGPAVLVGLVVSNGGVSQGLGFGESAAKAAIEDVMLGEGETVTVCLPVFSSFEDDGKSIPGLYRYEEGREWNLLSGSRIETVNGIESVCADVSSFPALVGVFVEVSEPPVVEGESGGGCSVVSAEGGSESFNVAFNLFLIMFSFMGVSWIRRQICVHRDG